MCLWPRRASDWRGLPSWWPTFLRPGSAHSDIHQWVPFISLYSQQTVEGHETHSQLQRYISQSIAVTSKATWKAPRLEHDPGRGPAVGGAAAPCKPVISIELPRTSKNVWLSLSLSKLPQYDHHGSSSHIPRLMMYDAAAVLQRLSHCSTSGGSQNASTVCNAFPRPETNLRPAANAHA